MQWENICGSDDAKCLVLPVRSGLHYFKCIWCYHYPVQWVTSTKSNPINFHPQYNTKFSFLINSSFFVNISPHALEYRNNIIS